ncbi:MAG: DUF192 domain-containing protein [Spirochaetes bacterium]|nr:DUF192 domain-containing protein [Spirochaetota bacterium]
MRNGRRSAAHAVRIILPAAVLIITLASASLCARGGPCILRILNSDGNAVSLTVEIADTERRRQTGLMHRKTMPREHGMLFVFPREQKMNFWMKNTYIPLSIAYIDSNGVIREIYDMKPLDTSVTYPSALPALYALEVNRGWFRLNNISTGCRIVLDGCVGK